MIKYIYAQNTELITSALASRIKEKLDDGQSVLWLLSGGSGANVCLDAAKLLVGSSLDNLYVTLSDERYGVVGHADENWQQLIDGGFELPGATLYRPLQGLSVEETTVNMGTWLDRARADCDYAIGLFGMGPDGHTAGIKPHSVVVSSPDTTAHYIAEDFSRITVTPVYIQSLDEAMAQSFGTDRHNVIAQLLDEELDLARQPAQVLKRVPVSTFYSDLRRTV